MASLQTHRTARAVGPATVHTHLGHTGESTDHEREAPPPCGAEALARIVYSFAQCEDVDGYRGLYLNRTEAVRNMVEATAPVYTEPRARAVFEEVFEQLFEPVPPGARFEQGSLTEKNVVKRWAIDPDDRRHKIRFGTIMHVGAIMRLAAPVTKIEASSAIEHLRQ